MNESAMKGIERLVERCISGRLENRDYLTMELRKERLYAVLQFAVYAGLISEKDRNMYLK